MVSGPTTSTKRLTNKPVMKEGFQKQISAEDRSSKNGSYFN